MKIIQKNKLTIIGVLIGLVGGYLYYHYIGCNSGTCAITSKPLNSTLYGGLMGGLLLNMFQKKNPQN
ncbi:MAG: DUF6132 family protein [Urechidicola sp.]|nr:DUF6132 family protein [Urechidicola sp.]